MSISVTFNGTSYTIPSPGEADWATTLNTFLQALAAWKPTAAINITATTGPAITGTALTGTGINGVSLVGHGLVATGDSSSPVYSAFRIVPQDTQPSGPNAVGDIYVTTAGLLKICTVAGTPGTWVSVGAQ